MPLGANDGPSGFSATRSPGGSPLNGSAPGLAVTQAQQGERRGEVAVFLGEGAVARVLPAAIVILALRERHEELRAPGVALALCVLELFLAQGVHRLGERVVVVEEAGLAHAGVLLERV